MLMWHVHCMLDALVYKHTHTEYIILIAFPLQQWYKRAPVLHYTYIACVVLTFNKMA
jgi:hypothetical protein